MNTEELVLGAQKGIGEDGIEDPSISTSTTAAADPAGADDSMRDAGNAQMQG